MGTSRKRAPSAHLLSIFHRPKQTLFQMHFAVSRLTGLDEGDCALSPPCWLLRTIKMVTENEQLGGTPLRAQRLSPLKQGKQFLCCPSNDCDFTPHFQNEHRASETHQFQGVQGDSTLRCLSFLNLWRWARNCLIEAWRFEYCGRTQVRLMRSQIDMHDLVVRECNTVWFLYGEKIHEARGECLPGARPARYFSINYPNFSPRFTL